MIDHRSQFPPAIEGCLVSLDRCLDLIDGVDTATFIAPTPHHGTVGAHLRHCIEYFRCFFGEERTGSIEYDARERDLLLETDRERSRRAIVEIIEKLRSLGSSDLHRTVQIHQVLAPDTAPELVLSSAKRELMGLSEHTIHHLAILSQLLEALGTDHSDPALGVAYSTQAHRDAAVRRSPSPILD